MRVHLWRRLFAASVGAIALAGAVSAQSPAKTVPVKLPIPEAPSGNTAFAQPAPGPTVPSVPAASAGTAVPPAPSAVILGGSGGCANCGPAARPVGTGVRNFVMESGGGYYGTNCSTSQNCNNGCGSLRSDLGFMFGSCRSFFAPCGPRPLGCSGCGNCLTPVYGSGSCGPFNPCVYDSYLNH